MNFTPEQTELLKAVREALQGLLAATPLIIGGDREQLDEAQEEAEKALETLDTLLAEQGRHSGDSTDMVQPVSALVGALYAEIEWHDSDEPANPWNLAIYKAIAIARQHTREPDVEAGARAIQLQKKFVGSFGEAVIATKACIAPAWKGLTE